MATAAEPARDAPPHLTVYSRAYCHLCEDMIAGLRRLQERARFTFDVIDIDGDVALAARYDLDVPVLAHGAREIARHRLDEARLETWLRRRKGQSST
ncbi:MAG: glutaredoxin family protein [Burkholderiales bacterium]|nr:glutaredoxin family protein [Burkholderiales bacterium]